MQVSCKGKFKLFGELAGYAGFYFKENVEIDPQIAKEVFIPENKPRLERLKAELSKLEPFTHEQVGATFGAVAKELGIKTGILVHPARLACCGKPAGPSLYHLMAILGKDRCLDCIDKALDQM